MTVRRGVIGLVLAAAMLLAWSCRLPPERLPPAPAGMGIAEQGREIFEAAGCGACHVVSEIPNARGRVGPSLDRMGGRSFVAGQLPNNLENLAEWIYDPQAVDPGNAMPRVGLTRREALDVAAYLITLR